MKVLFLFHFILIYEIATKTRTKFPAKEDRDAVGSRRRMFRICVSERLSSERTEPVLAISARASEREISLTAQTLGNPDEPELRFRGKAALST
jgi:hypothetical protein